MFDYLQFQSKRFEEREKELQGHVTSIKHHFGVDVLWCSKKDGGNHISTTELEPHRQIGDEALDEILETLHREGNPLGPADDFLFLAKASVKKFQQTPGRCKESDIKMSNFISQYENIPSWVDMNQIERGQNVFLAYAGSMGITLFYKSLVAGFSIPKIAAVIRSTGYLAPPSKPEQVQQRLLDTGQLISACVGHGIDALLPGGDGWRTAIHVRVLHAKVRRAILRKQGKRKWDLEKYGIPINQEDMAGTLLAFSLNPLLGTEFITGASLPMQEKLDYLALWRYIGWLLGVDTIDHKYQSTDASPLDPCGPGISTISNPIQNSEAILESIILHLVHPDETSVQVAHHILKSRGSSKPGEITSVELSKSVAEKSNMFYLRAMICRAFIGDPLADALKLPLHPNKGSRLSIQFRAFTPLFILRLYTLATIYIPFFRRIVISWHRFGLQKMRSAWKEKHESKKNGKICNTISKTNPKDESYAHGFSKPSCPFAMILLENDDTKENHNITNH